MRVIPGKTLSFRNVYNHHNHLLGFAKNVLFC
jgi:hypothetical protein